MSAVVVVFAVPGREDVTGATLDALDGPGGASTLDCERLLFWSAPTPPTIEVPIGWSKHWHNQTARGSVAALGDFVAMLDVVGDRDLVFIEDDVYPCRNAVPYMVRLASPHVVHFFNASSPMFPYGLRALPPGGFEFSQALRIPAPVVKALRASPPTSRGRFDGWDLAIGMCLHRMRLPLFQHRSLVRHTGFRSMWNPGNDIAARLPARDYPGDDFDALTLLPSAA